MKKIYVTGGHLTPALSVMAELKQRNWQIVYLGRYHALEGDNALSQEYQEITKAGYEFIPITAGRIQRNLTAISIIGFLKIPFGFVQVLFHLTTNRPQVILSFGGYLAVPTALIGWVMNIPVVTHEQTLSPGIGNQIIGRIAKAVCIGWQETRKYFPPEKTFYTGNPLRKEIFQIGNKPFVPLTKPLLYITGGNLGAHAINVVVEDILEELLQKFTVVHQCGNAQKYQDYSRLLDKKNKLPKNFGKHYFPFTYIGRQIGWILHHAQVIVSRAGANIVTEIIACQKATLFIPLPWSGEGEQEKNAQFLVDKGAARLLHQSELTGQKLLDEIYITDRQKGTMIKNLQSMSQLIIHDADAKVARVVESVV